MLTRRRCEVHVTAHACQMYQSFKVTHHAQSRIANVSSSCSASRVHELLSVPAPTVTIGLLKSQCMCNASMHHTQQSKRQATIAMEPTLHVYYADALCVAFSSSVQARGADADDVGVGATLSLQGRFTDSPIGLIATSLLSSIRSECLHSRACTATHRCYKWLCKVCDISANLHQRYIQPACLLRGSWPYTRRASAKRGCTMLHSGSTAGSRFSGGPTTTPP